METITHDDSNDIPVFSLDPVQIKDKDSNDMDFTELQYSEQYALLSAQETDDETPFDPIELDEVIHKQLTVPFCVEVRRKLNEVRISAFELDDEGVIVRSSDQ